MMVHVPVSVAELIDKITILDIKLEHMSNPNQLANVQLEYRLLCQQLNNLNLSGLDIHMQELRQVNQLIWDVENFKRACEARQCFDEQFIEAARNVYRYNDRRAAIKREINQLVGSTIREEKLHHVHKET